MKYHYIYIKYLLYLFNNNLITNNIYLYSYKSHICILLKSIFAYYYITLYIHYYTFNGSCRSMILKNLVTLKNIVSLSNPVTLKNLEKNRVTLKKFAPFLFFYIFIISIKIHMNYTSV